MLCWGGDTGCKKADPEKGFSFRKSTRPAVSGKRSGHYLMRHFRNDQWGYEVEIPRTGFSVRTRDYNRKLPPRKFCHRLIVRHADGSRLVALQLWKNPLHLDLKEWFNRFVFELVSEQAHRTTAAVSDNIEDVLVFARGPSFQSPARRQAFLRLGPWMARLVCFNDDDPDGAAIFDHMLTTLDATEAAEVQP